MRAMTKILNDNPDLRGDALELAADGTALEHIGSAKGVYKLKLPVTVNTIRRLFAAISVDPTLVKKKRRVGAGVAAASTAEAEEADEPLDGDSMNPGLNIETVKAQTYQNYKSALKWWVELEDITGRDKQASTWPPDVDLVVAQQIKAYKRDVGVKKRCV